MSYSRLCRNFSCKRMEKKLFIAYFKEIKKITKKLSSLLFNQLIS